MALERFLVGQVVLVRFGWSEVLGTIVRKERDNVWRVSLPYGVFSYYEWEISGQ